jgi:hypothetical protein
MYLVMDKDGNPWGPFEKSGDAAWWAHQKWPGAMDDPRSPPDKEGWSIVAIRPAD